ncbi:hypothetical protein M422DRAFT_268290 [Sphaerobolus stellatus SS14]|uniref:DUF6532 domain-containing protein n=1 Tax=Sphaerobolus stellatus (strain SS14) TaxID=990650 RepID=A0A0C9UXY1_SPHS4|nr:hypothetical protein M422DRAFT_268290 [Sphaerobolus stellatus SS14]
MVSSSLMWMERRLRPFGHPAISSLIQKIAFEMKDGAARLQSSVLEPMPFATIALASVALLNTIQEYSKGVRQKVSMDGAIYQTKYEGIMQKLDYWYSTKPEHCLAHQQLLFSDGMGRLEKTIRESDDEFVVEDSDVEEAMFGGSVPRVWLSWNARDTPGPLNQLTDAIQTVNHGNFAIVSGGPTSNVCINGDGGPLDSFQCPDIFTAEDVAQAAQFFITCQNCASNNKGATRCQIQSANEGQCVSFLTVDESKTIELVDCSSRDPNQFWSIVAQA